MLRCSWAISKATAAKVCLEPRGLLLIGNICKEARRCVPVVAGDHEAFRIFNDHVRNKYNAEAGFITMNMPMLMNF